MTGLLGRLRAWLLGESDDSEDTDEATDESSRVVHRDDRPLETPGTMERPNPPTPGDESTDTVDIPDAESGGDSAVSTSEGGAVDADVSIPDAESAVADGTDATGTVETVADADGDAASADAESVAQEADETDGAADSMTTGGAGEDAEFACSVCGTAVDDPSVSCPLCRSTDVVPVDDAPTDEDAPSRGGRTAVSTDDGEAADRLNDVRSADER
ncbi:hypothetical protein [Haloplanus sp. C73]|uniref:hypothetical protein n=1 Tax=Haloplanus sp. C73 TaxID=3421641 RepID=UPI003EC06DF3